MLKIKMSGEFGATLFQEYPMIKSCDSGIFVECPLNGYICVYDMGIRNFREYHADIELEQKKKLFQKSNNNTYKVYFLSKGSAHCKGFTSKMIYDIDYGNTPTEVNMAYDYDIKIALGRYSDFINFISSNNIKNASNGEIYQKYLNGEINKVIKEVIGKELKKTSVTDVESLSLTISTNIMDILNSNASCLYNYGLIVNNFCFNIAESYMHREEKKRVKHNEIL